MLKILLWSINFALFQILLYGSALNNITSFGIYEESIEFKLNISSVCDTLTIWYQCILKSQYRFLKRENVDRVFKYPSLDRDGVSEQTWKNGPPGC